MNDNNALILCYFLIALGLLLILYNSLYFLDAIRKNKPKFYYSNILHLSDLRYRFSNNKKIFILTICLIGIVVYFQVFAVTVAHLSQNNIIRDNPYHIMYTEYSDESYPSTSEINGMAGKADAKVAKNVELPVYLSSVNNNVFSTGALKKALGVDLEIKRGECIIYTQYSIYDGHRHEDKIGSTFTISNDKLNKTYKIKSVKYKVLINTDMTLGHCVILNNKDYDDIISNTGGHSSLQYRVINCATLNQSERLYKAINTKYDMDAEGLLASSRFSNLKLGKQISAFVILVLSTMDLMVFLLNLMMIHFKLLTNIDSDRKKYGIIQKLGFTLGEIRKTVQKNIDILMIWPVVIAVIFGGSLVIGLMRLSKTTLYTTICVLIVGAVIIFFQYIVSRLYIKYYMRKLLE